MNRNFKVVFSKARGALMVVNEATSSVQAKGTKTVIAAAVAALSLGAGVASAADSQTFDDVQLNANTTLTITNGESDFVYRLVLSVRRLTARPVLARPVR